MRTKLNFIYAMLITLMIGNPAAIAETESNASSAPSVSPHGMMGANPMMGMMNPGMMGA